MTLPVVTSMLLTIDVFSVFLCTIHPSVDPLPSFLVVRILALENVAILEMNAALSMGISVDPQALEHTTIEEQRTIAMPATTMPLTRVDTAVSSPHYTIAVSFTALISEARVLAALRHRWTTSDWRW